MSVWQSLWVADAAARQPLEGVDHGNVRPAGSLQVRALPGVAADRTCTWCVAVSGLGPHWPAGQVQRFAVAHRGRRRWPACRFRSAGDEAQAGLAMFQAGLAMYQGRASRSPCSSVWLGT